MATISFLIFIPLGILFTYLIRPKHQAMFWVWSILIPFMMLVVTSFGLGGGDGYRTGQLVAECLISFLCTIVAMLIFFYSKAGKK